MHKLIYPGMWVCGPPSLDGMAGKAVTSLLFLLSEQLAVFL